MFSVLVGLAVTSIVFGVFLLIGHATAKYCITPETPTFGDIVRGGVVGLFLLLGVAGLLLAAVGLFYLVGEAFLNLL